LASLASWRLKIIFILPTSNNKEGFALFLAGGVLLTLSGVSPHDRGTWVLETFPIFIAAPLLIVTARRFPLTPLAYRLIFLHALVLMLGAHYTYALVPIGSWVQEAFDLSRNHYDRLGHFIQGFAPAVIAREILLRTSPLRPGKWLFTLVAAMSLAISACYEFIEWAAAVILGQGAEAFLSTQGDQWDTQWDMFLALIGAILAQLLLAGWHNRQLKWLRAVK